MIRILFLFLALLGVGQSRVIFSGTEWDSSNCVLALAFNAWSKGNGTSNQNTGEMPGYPDGDYNATFTNMASGYGFVYNSGDGYCNFDGTNDYINTGLTESFTTTCKKTWEFKLKSNDYSNAQKLFCIYNDNDNRMDIQITTSNRLDFLFIANSAIERATSTTTLTNGNEYTLHFVKDEDELRIYIDGVEVSYGTQDAFTFTWNPSADAQIGIRNSADLPFDGEMYWVAYYKDALSHGRITANSALGNDMGLVGNNAGDVMAVYSIYTETTDTIKIGGSGNDTLKIGY